MQPLPRFKHGPRRCSVCGDPYHRRNLMESWTSQNPGHRAGWIKTTIKVCTRCAKEPTARRLVIVASQVRKKP